MLRYIRIKKDGQPIKSTGGHCALLKKYGYKVKEDGDFLSVECNGVIEGEVDVSSTEKAKTTMAEVVKNHRVFSYQTKFKFPDGQTLHGVFACRRLGKISALVTRNTSEDKAKKPSSFLDEIL